MDTGLCTGNISPQIRYSDALKNSIKQEAIMQQVMAMDGIGNSWDSIAVEEKMLQPLS